jgi:hypothetical protein
MNPGYSHLPPLQLTFDSRLVAATIRALWPWIFVAAAVMACWIWAVDQWQLDLRLALALVDDGSMLDATVWISAVPVIVLVTFFLLMLLRIAIVGYVPAFGRVWRSVQPSDHRVRVIGRVSSHLRPPRFSGA